MDKQGRGRGARLNKVGCLSRCLEMMGSVFISLFPSRCIVCQKTVHSSALTKRVEICQKCYRALPHNQNCCLHCALPLPEEISGQVVCGRCIRSRPIYNYSHSLFRYEGDVIALIHQLKFGEKITYARTIGELLLARYVDVLLKKQGKPDCIIPVPLHETRLRQRGYNQSIEISRVLASRLKIPIAYGAVRKDRKTSAQSELKEKERQKNVRGVFSCHGVESYSHVLIIDDVVTTGSTVKEVSKVLRKNGVKKIGVLSVARAPLRN